MDRFGDAFPDSSSLCEKTCTVLVRIHWRDVRLLGEYLFPVGKTGLLWFAARSGDAAMSVRGDDLHCVSGRGSVLST